MEYADTWTGWTQEVQGKALLPRQKSLTMYNTEREANSGANKWKTMKTERILNDWMIWWRKGYEQEKKKEWCKDSKKKKKYV